MRLTRKGQAVDAAAARVLPADSSGTGDDARVVVDFGKAYVEDGHANGGEVIEIDLKREDGDYRVARVGFAVFPDQPRRGVRPLLNDKGVRPLV